MNECGRQKDTMYGFPVVCSKEAGHDGWHESANFAWSDSMNWAAAK
jgi:hypothetical protein